MKKFNKLLMTTTVIVYIFGWNIHSNPVAAMPNYIGRWYDVGLSNEYISLYRVFQKDVQVHSQKNIKLE
jgi:hypothetical protein